LAFIANVDSGDDAIQTDAVVVTSPGQRSSDPTVPGAMTSEDAWARVESGTLGGRVVLVMGRSSDALLLAGAIKGGREAATVDVLYREMAVAERGMQELQLELAAKGVRFHRFAAGSLRLGPEVDGTREVRFVDELLPDAGEVLLAADAVIAQPPSGPDAGPAWPISAHAVAGVPSMRRLNVLPVTTPRRGVYTGTPGTLTDSAMHLGGLAAVTMALADYARGFPPCDEVAEVDPDECAACLNCLRVCPHDAIVFDEEARAARILRRACQSCGLCVSTCPALAITMVRGEGGDAIG
jgi:heterodisulfide reductase subunit A